MSDNDDFASMLAEFEQKNPSPKKRKDPQVGDSIRGKVVSIGQDSVFVDLGAKSEGMIELAEVRDEKSGKILVAVGDEIEARVVETSGKSGCIVLRKTLGRGADGKAELVQAFELGIPVDGTVSAVNKGGVEVQIAGVRAFCPISQLDIRHVEDATPFLGLKLAFRITRYEPGPRGNLVVSRRALLDEEQQAKATETRALLVPGAVLRGRVTSLKDYGAFVDLGGIEGMLHISELGFSRVGHPKDLLSVNQDIEVQILKIQKTDDPKHPEKISLSLKSLERDPWKDAAERFPAGARVPGTVMRVEPFGAFVELAPGIEGLVHISELGKKVNHPREVVKPTDTVQVTILGVDLEKRRISLSLEDKGDEISAEDAPRPSAPQKLGTFGDLLAKSQKPKKPAR